MKDVVMIVESELNRISSTSTGSHLKTGEIRKLSGKLFQNLHDKSRENVIDICESLLEQRNWPMGVIAFDFALRIKNHFDSNTFSIFKVGLLSM